jgi:hypothetical protein
MRGRAAFRLCETRASHDFVSGARRMVAEVVGLRLC